MFGDGIDVWAWMVGLCGFIVKGIVIGHLRKDTPLISFDLKKLNTWIGYVQCSDHAVLVEDFLAQNSDFQGYPAVTWWIE